MTCNVLVYYEIAFYDSIVFMKLDMWFYVSCFIIFEFNFEKKLVNVDRYHRNKNVNIRKIQKAVIMLFDKY